MVSGKITNHQASYSQSITEEAHYLEMLKFPGINAQVLHPVGKRSHWNLPITVGKASYKAFLDITFLQQYFP